MLLSCFDVEILCFSVMIPSKNLKIQLWIKLTITAPPPPTPEPSYPGTPAPCLGIPKISPSLSDDASTSNDMTHEEAMHSASTPLCLQGRRVSVIALVLDPLHPLPCQQQAVGDVDRDLVFVGLEHPSMFHDQLKSSVLVRH